MCEQLHPGATLEIASQQMLTLTGGSTLRDTVAVVVVSVTFQTEGYILQATLVKVVGIWRLSPRRKKPYKP